MDSLNVHTARRWFTLALGELAAARESLDALNVFPVPDGDTGTNVVLTMTSGARAAAAAEVEGIGQLAGAFAEGALWGARGNSGIIVAQWFQAVAASLEGRREAVAVDLIRSFDAVASASRTAVAEPVHGTMITVAEAVAAAVLALPERCSLAEIVGEALEAAVEATDCTSEQLPVLRGTGRVDAGAVCLVLIIEALARTLGLPALSQGRWFEGLSAPKVASGGGYEVMYLLRATEREAGRLRRHLGAVGESVIVTHGAQDLWHVHVHLPHPREALAAASMSQVCVRRLEARTREVGVVAATAAPGLLEPLAEVADVAVLNASARTLVRAITDARAPEVLVLPCSEASSREAARAARDPSILAEDIRVHVAPTGHDLQVLEAASLLSAPPCDAGAALALAAQAASLAVCDIPELPADPLAMLDTLARSILAHRPELVTLLVGSHPGAGPAARHLATILSASSLAVEVQTIEGGQNYPLAVSAL